MPRWRAVGACLRQRPPPKNAHANFGVSSDYLESDFLADGEEKGKYDDDDDNEEEQQREPQKENRRTRKRRWRAPRRESLIFGGGATTTWRFALLSKPFSAMHVYLASELPTWSIDGATMRSGWDSAPVVESLHITPWLHAGEQLRALALRSRIGGRKCSQDVRRRGGQYLARSGLIELRF